SSVQPIAVQSRSQSTRTASKSILRVGRSIDAPALAAEPVIDLGVLFAQALIPGEHGMRGLGERAGALAAPAAPDERTREQGVELRAISLARCSGGEPLRSLEEPDGLRRFARELELAEHQQILVNEPIVGTMRLLAKRDAAQRLRPRLLAAP